MEFETLRMDIPEEDLAGLAVTCRGCDPKDAGFVCKVLFIMRWRRRVDLGNLGAGESLEKSPVGECEQRWADERGQVHPNCWDPLRGGYQVVVEEI